jgi:hypothetical protein
MLHWITFEMPFHFSDFFKVFIKTGFLASLSFSICSWITFESVMMMKVCWPKDFIFLSAKSKASYSVVLFVECSLFTNMSRAAHLITTPAGDVTTTLLTDKRRIPLRSASVRTPHLFHHGIPKVLVNPRSKGITSA